MEKSAWCFPALALPPLGAKTNRMYYNVWSADPPTDIVMQFSPILCRAATNCDVFVLTKANLDRALSYYPEIAEQIREVAGNRANLVKKRSQIAAKAAAEGKSAADAAKAAAQVRSL